MNLSATILASWVRLTWYRLQFPGLSVGKQVRIGAGVRISVLVGARLVLGDRVTIEPGCQLVSCGHLAIGPDSFVGTGSVIVSSQSIDIGRDALIASHVTIRDQDHGVSGVPFRKQPLSVAPVKIGANVWLGAGAVVLKGVTIGDNSVLGANAVVTSDIPPGMIAAGVPARVSRHLDLTESALTPPPP